MAKHAVLTAMLTVFCMVGSAQNTPYSVDYFPNLNTADGQKTVVNTGFISDSQGPGNLCDMVYVFDREQIMECCGCYVTPNGSRDWASVNAGFNANNLTGSPKAAVIVKQVTASGANIFTDADATTRTVTPDGSVFFPSGSCDPRSYRTSSGLISWAVKTQVIGSGAPAITETPSQNAALSTAEASDLTEDCGLVIELGSQQGICTCGTFD
jgi:hypothetical protein